MEMKLELVAVPVGDVDRAKASCLDRVGFVADHDHQVNDDLRFVQLTPPGSACSIVLGTGITTMPPGSQLGLQMVVADAEGARGPVLAWPAADPSPLVRSFVRAAAEAHRRASDQRT